MRQRKNIWPGIGLGILLAGVMLASLWPHRGEVPIEVTRVDRKDLTSIVRATGEIHAQTYTNVLAQNFGRVTQILVHEGERVQPGDLLLRVDSVQATANVSADQAAVNSANAGLRAAADGVANAESLVAQRQADLNKAKFDWEKNEGLYKAEVISRQAVESTRTAYNAAKAALNAAQAKLAAARAQQLRVARTRDQAAQQLAHDQDVLSKMIYRAPIAGTVTYIATHVGEDIVPGVPETTGAYLMTIVNMLTVNAQVRVDENDIVNLHPGQPADIHIDAYPNRQFTGTVYQVGAQAVFANTGQATMQAINGAEQEQQEKDYKVILNVADLPPSVRPGMTLTAVVDTVHKSKVLAIPFQALLLRPKNEVGRLKPPMAPQAEPVALSTNPQTSAPEPSGVQGVFVVRKDRAIFVPVQVGILGADDIEVKTGLKESDEIVMGDFTALRQLHSGDAVKITKMSR